jgi:hypothetical protein
LQQPFDNPPQTQNPNIEIRNKSEESKSETAGLGSPVLALAFSVLFGFVSDFVFRISDLVPFIYSED